jgi:leader peptidase (prepilin peptidase)/N-methyltransferase
MVDTLPLYRTLFALFAFVVGAVVGSFLNVCIYRLPRDLSVNRPRRSFCPHCKKQIAWHDNLPLLSWLLLRARCRHCGAVIHYRYFAVELLTASLFLALWMWFPPLVAFAYWILASLLIVATFIDLEHYIIPDEITLVGVGVGLLASLAVPAVMGTSSRLIAIVRAGLAALLGYVLLWVVLEAGKVAFGKKRIRLDAPTPFKWKRVGDDAEFTIGEEQTMWSEYFARESDRLLISCDTLEIDRRVHNKLTVEFYYNRVSVAGEVSQLDQTNEINGLATELVIPREAMGRGDLKFLAAIGAFLGWRGVLFSLFGGSLLGSLVGLLALVIGKRVWSAKLPFGPYLAMAALLWIFFGSALADWYVNLLRP